MQPASFWKEALLGSWADDCVWHAIVPTAMMAIGGTWKDAVANTDTADEKVAKAQRSHIACALCGRSTESQPHVVAVRVMYGKRRGTTISGGTLDMDGMTCHAYRVGTSAAAICVGCANTFYQPSNAHIDSNAAMIWYVLDRIDDLAKYACSSPNIFFNLSGPTMWECIVDRFTRNHNTITQKLGKRGRDCGHCGKEQAKDRCSACNYVYYCGETCSRANWNKHKTQCDALKNLSIFCYEPIDLGKSSKMLRDILAARLGK
jgi:hypothetical protein